jgi:hypothetical protein
MWGSVTYSCYGLQNSHHLNHDLKSTLSQVEEPAVMSAIIFAFTLSRVEEPAIASAIIITSTLSKVVQQVNMSAPIVKITLSQVPGHAMPGVIIWFIRETSFVMRCYNTSLHHFTSLGFLLWYIWFPDVHPNVGKQCNLDTSIQCSTKRDK